MRTFCGGGLMLALMAPVVGCSVAGAFRGHAAARLFVANYGDDTVSVIDTSLDREVAVLPVGRSPQTLALRQHPPLLAVANSGASTVSLIDPVSLKALPDPVTVCRGPETVAFSADGARLFATCYYDKNVTITDLASRTPLHPPLVFERTPRGLLVTPDGTRLLVLLHDEQGAIAVIDLATWQVDKTIPVDRFPVLIVLTPDRRRIVVGSSDLNTLTFFDAVTLERLETQAVDTDLGVVMHPTKPLLYSLLSFDGQALAYDYAARTRRASIPVGDWPTRGAITSDGHFLYVANGESNNAVKVDTETNEAVLRIAVGSDPEDVVILER
jgi:YVTN family beta-propeller protein